LVFSGATFVALRTAVVLSDAPLVANS